MSTFIAVPTDAPGLMLSVFALMCVISFIGSAITTTLGLGGGALVIAVMALLEHSPISLTHPAPPPGHP